MTRPRLSIAGLMAVVLVAALGTKALRTPTALWAGGMFTLTPAGLAIGLLGLVYREGPGRAFWVGFSVFGWGYWIATLSPWVGEAIQPKMITTEALDVLFAKVSSLESTESFLQREFLASSPVKVLKGEMAHWDRKIADAKRLVRNPSDPIVKRLEAQRKELDAELDYLWETMHPRLMVRAGSASRLAPAQSGHFFTVGHSLFTLLSALLGGMIAVRFHRTRDPAPCPSDESSTTNPSTT